LNSTPVTVVTDVTGLLADGWVATIQSDVDSLNSTPVTIDTNVTGDAEEQVQEISSDITNLPATQSIEIDQTGDADTQIETIKDDAENLPTDINIEVDETGDAETSLNDTSSAADNLEDQENDAGAAGEQAGGDINDGMGIAAAGITAAGSAAEDLTQELYDAQTSMQQLAIFSGETNSQMTTLINNITSASVSQQYAEQYVQTLMQLGVPNDLLQKNADELAKIGEATGNDAETTSAFAQTVVALGGDAQDMGDYLGMAGYEQQNFVGGLANFSQMAPMFAVQMSAMGFSTQQAAVIMADMSQKTGGTRKGMMALMTAANGSGAALLNELNTTTPAVNTQADSFANYTDKVNQASAADEANQSWLKQLQTDYTKLMLTLGDIGPEILTIAGAIGGLVAGPSALLWGFDKLFQTDPSLQAQYNNWLKTKLQPVTDLMKAALKKAGIDIGGSVEDAGDTIKDDVGDVGEDIGNEFGTTFTVIGKDIEDDIKDNLNFSDVDDRLKSTADELESDIEGSLNTLKSTFTSGFDSLGSAVKTGLNNIGDSATDGISNVKSIFSKLGDIIPDTSGMWKSNSSNMEDGIIDLFKNADGTWEAQAPSFLDKISKFGSDLVGDVTDIKLPDITSLGLKIPSGVLDGIKEGLPDLGEGVGSDLTLGVLGGLQVADTNVKSYWETSFPDLFKNTEPLTSVLSSVLNSSTFAPIWDSIKAPTENMMQLLGLNNLTTLTPEELLDKIFGSSAVAGVENWWDKNIYDPTNAGITKVENAITGIVFSKNPLGSLESYLSGGVTGVEDDLSKFTSFMTGEPEKWTGPSWTNISTNMGLIFGNISKTVNGGVSDVQNDFNGLSSWITNFKLPTGYQIGQDLIAGLTDTVWGVVDAVKDIEGGYNDLKTFIGKLPGEFSSDVKSLWNDITTPATQADTDTKNDLGNIQKDYTNFQKFINGLPATIGADSKALWNDINNDINQGEKEIKSDLTAAENDFTQFEKDLKNAPAQFGADITNIWNTMKADFVAGENDLKADWNNFVSWFTSIPSQLETDGKNAIDGIQKGIKAGEQDVENELHNLETDFMNDVKWIENLPGEMLTWGENTIKGFVTGIEDGVPGLNQALKALSALFPHSPPEAGPLTDVTSDNMTSYAGTLMNGFITGVTNNVSGVLTALKTIASLFPHSPVESGPLADVTTGNMENYGSSLVDSMAAGITVAAPAVTSALAAIQSDVNNTVSSADSELVSMNTSGTSATTSTSVATSATATAAALNTLTAATTAATTTTTTSSGSLLNAMSTITSDISSVAPILSSIEEANIAAQAGATAQAVTVNFHPNSINLPDGVTPESARNIAGAFGDEVANRINKGAINNGLKPYSIYNNPNIKH